MHFPDPNWPDGASKYVNVLGLKANSKYCSAFFILRFSLFKYYEQVFGSSITVNMIAKILIQID